MQIQVSDPISGGLLWTFWFRRRQGTSWYRSSEGLCSIMLADKVGLKTQMLDWEKAAPYLQLYSLYRGAQKNVYTLFRHFLWVSHHSIRWLWHCGRSDGTTCAGRRAAHRSYDRSAMSVGVPARPPRASTAPARALLLGHSDTAVVSSRVLRNWSVLLALIQFYNIKRCDTILYRLPNCL